ncbi:T-cell leukemia translocation-altered gene protein isoform X1 [Antechinus flavipes]|uniref:T-cell leukemia translocation-altered gene protein homolog n=2 Tax=Metatheria TaxID=9263 RepID=A0A7N4PJU4_SARHA|nr:T-cell leukemia translocation-altered gene protein isoform X1 [Sarcophilus harrisii]XP_051842748.1 T-cell leukemia translocation-altered gene protein isoform X1 [Antechinus flavipes]
MAAESGSELGWQALPTAVLGALSTLGSEFLREWEAQDMRVTLFKLLLLWLVLSLLGIQLAWGVYGSTVTGLYHRPSSGLGGQNGSTPDGSSLFPPWETSENESIKTHRE